MSKPNDNRVIRVLQFLDAYEKQESLWNPSLESYKNKIAREEAYMQIIRDLNVPSLTILDIKLKVKSIRTTYTKELRLLTKLKDEGKSYSPKLFWFNRANAFLKNVSLSRDKRSHHSEKINQMNKSFKSCEVDYIPDISQRENFATEPSDIMSNGDQNDPENTTSSAFEYKALCGTDLENQVQADTTNMAGEQKTDTDPIKMNQQTHDDFQQEDTTSVLNTKLTATTTEIANTGNSLEITPQPTTIHNGNFCKDEYDFFCRSVAAQLRSISDTYSRSVAKLKIQQILFEAETGHYRNNPCITIPVSNMGNI